MAISLEKSMDKPLAVLFGCCSKPNLKPFPEFETNVSAGTNQSEKIWEEILSAVFLSLSLQAAYLDVSYFLMDVLPLAWGPGFQNSNSGEVYILVLSVSDSFP